MEPLEGRIGPSDFVQRHGLYSDEQIEAGNSVCQLLEDQDIEEVRLSFADQHGLLRGKSLTRQHVSLAMRNGCSVSSALLAKDTSHRTIYPIFSPGGGFGIPQMSGGGDILMVPDPTTFRILPWVPGTGWMLCDIYFPDGNPVPFSTRQIYRDTLHELSSQGYDYVAGLEVEFHIFRLEDAKLQPSEASWPADPPEVSLLAHGYQWLTESRMEQLQPIIEVLRRHVIDIGLPLRSIEVEFGPSQCEFTFEPDVGMAPADAMVLFRSLVKQVCWRHGYHATFMSRPNLPNLLSAGWHLHQSLRHRDNGRNAFMSDDRAAVLSPMGRNFVGGLLAHARAGSILTTPTINGYKRYWPPTLAPDRIAWAHDNKGAMVRVIGGPNDLGTHLENRIGEPAANPYLYMTSQILAGMDGVANALDPGDPTEEPYAVEAVSVPKSLIEALAALREDAFFRLKLGDTFVDYLITVKEAEIDRFLSTVTDWEHREYFEMF